MKKWLVWLCLLTACTQHVSESLAPRKTTEIIRSLPSFQNISMIGPFDVTLYTGNQHPRVIIKGIPEAIPFVTTQVNHQGTLLIRCPQQCAEHGKIALQLYTDRLRNVKYKGEGIIVGKSLHAASLNLFIQNAGSTHLGGYLGLHHVVIQGGKYTILEGVHTTTLRLTLKDKAKVQIAGYIHPKILKLSNGSWLSMYWIEAHRLMLVERGDTVIQMAGIVHTLDLELWDEARFKGRYLRADETFVKTHDDALAEITTLKHQHTIASDASDIYFYNIPPSKTNFMAYQGAVLDLRHFSIGE